MPGVQQRMHPPALQKNAWWADRKAEAEGVMKSKGVQVSPCVIDLSRALGAGPSTQCFH